MAEGNNNKVVPVQLFFSIVGIIVIALGWLFACVSRAENKTESLKADVAEMSIDIAEIKTNTSWIMQALQNIQKNPSSSLNK